MRRAKLTLAATVAAILTAFAATPAQAQTAASDPAWVQSALDSQYELGSTLPLVNAPTVGTHNSFNSAAEMGVAPSAFLNPNQRITLVEQLELGMRSLELDIHRFPSLTGGGFSPVVCHALENGVGCSIEKPLNPVLAQIGEWLHRRANRDQVLFLYLEDDNQMLDTYDDSAAAIDEHLGDILFRPPASTGEGCTELPVDSLSRDDIRADGKQVVIVSDCGLGASWQSSVFTWEQHLETRPFSFMDFPDCGPDFSRADYDTRLVRYFEDATQLTATTGEPDDGITPETAAAMTRCGVDLIGLDMLVPADPRLEALVWSWQPDEPDGGGRCAVIDVGPASEFGRWRDSGCREAKLPGACLIDGRWKVASKPILKARRAAKHCDRRGGDLGVPRSGFENQKLRLAMERRGVATAWLGYRKQGGEFAPLASG